MADNKKPPKKNSIPKLNEAQIKGCVSYVCQIKLKWGVCGFKTGDRKKIRHHLIKDHFKGGEAPLRQFYKVVS